jgi:hypothetical protein
MNTINPPRALNTVDGHKYFEWFYSTYEAAFAQLSEQGGVTEPLRLFDIRLTAAIGTEITLNEKFRHADSDDNREAYRLMLKLSNVWFSYEALIHACQVEGLLKNPSAKTDALNDDTISRLEHEYNFFDVRLDFWGMGGRIDGNPDHRSDLQQYIDHLTNGATSKEQKRTLADVYNRFTNNDLFSIKEALAFAYSVRNQYVHSGEAPSSGVKNISTKLVVLKISFDFLVLFCLRLGELLMDSRTARLGLLTSTAP